MMRARSEKNRMSIFLWKKKPPKIGSTNDQKDPLGQENRPGPHPRNEKETCCKSSENGAQGGKGVDLPNNVPGFLKVVERQLNDDRRDHTQKTGGNEEDE